MAKDVFVKAATNEVAVNGPQTVGYSGEDFEWENIHEEAPDQLVFDTLGDTYIGEYLGMDLIEFEDRAGQPQEFWQLRFRDGNGVKVLNAGYELRETYKEIPTGTITRTQLMKFVDVGQQSPMKSYRVDRAKAKTRADNQSGG
jgi:hypothetical protein